MAKIHYRDGTVVHNAPDYMKTQWKEKHEWGALCGYVRKNTTYNKDAVTCFYCLKEMERRKSFEY